MLEKVEYWHNKIEKTEILPISALEGFNAFNFAKLKLYCQKIHYYDKDQYTDKSERFFVNEKIREKKSC